MSVNDLKLRDVRWKFPLAEYAKDATVTQLVAEGEDLFVVDSKNRLHCLELDRGVHKWILDLPGQPSQALGLSDDTLGIVVKDRLILAKRKNGSRFLDKSLTIFPATPPAVTLYGAFVGVFIQNKLVALDGTTGTAGWSFRFNKFVTAAPKIYGTGAEMLLYAASNDGSVACLQPRPALGAAPAKPNWIFKAKGPNTADLAVSGKYLFVSSEDTSLYALNRLTGGIEWKFYAGVPLKKTVQIKDDSVYLKTDRSFYCLDITNGNEKWTFDKGAMLAAVVNDVAYVWTQDHNIALLDKASGKILKEVPGAGTCIIPNTGTDMLLIGMGTEIYGVK
jgi:outer membrane protein assembly factor BamB